jgi:hypothetical protein
MKLVIIESPFQGGKPENLRYLQRCIADCIKRGESPYASHRMLTGALDDLKPEERELGIKAGFEWHRRADLMVVYADYGITPGMEQGMQNAELLHLPMEMRKIGKNEGET